jgi:hypothetical protein
MAKAEDRRTRSSASGSASSSRAPTTSATWEPTAPCGTSSVRTWTPTTATAWSASAAKPSPRSIAKRRSPPPSRWADTGPRPPRSTSSASGRTIGSLEAPPCCYTGSPEGHFTAVDIILSRGGPRLAGGHICRGKPPCLKDLSLYCHPRSGKWDT